MEEEKGPVMTPEPELAAYLASQVSVFDNPMILYFTIVGVLAGLSLIMLLLYGCIWWSEEKRNRRGFGMSLHGGEGGDGHKIRSSFFMKMSQSLSIEKWDESKWGALSSQAMRRKLEAEGYHCTQYTFSPGTTFPDHTHPVSKKDAIVSGRFSFTMYGQQVTLGPGDTIEVPKKTVHSAAVVGDEDVIFFDSTK